MKNRRPALLIAIMALVGYACRGAATTTHYHTARLLPDRRVLIAVGFDGFLDLATTGLYDPKTGTFGPLG